MGNEDSIRPVWRTVANAADIASTNSEPELLRRARAGDEAAFGEIVRLHYERIYRHVVAMARNEHDAQDICQEIWIVVWRNLKSYREDSKLSTWLYSIATRRAIDHLRQRRRWYERFLPFLSRPESSERIDPVSLAANPREGLERRERHARFEQAVEALPPKQKAVLTLREIDGFSYEEIAHILHCRTGTVMSRLFNARRLLAQKLKDLPCE